MRRLLVGIGLTSLALCLPAVASYGQGYDREGDPGRGAASDTDRGTQDDRAIEGDRTVGSQRNIEEGVLKLSNEDVRRVKQALMECGVKVDMTDKKEIDSEALKNYQKQVGIEETGKLDIATLNALGFGAVVALSPNVKGAEMARGQIQGVSELPAGFQYEGAILGTGKNILGFVVVDEDVIKTIQKRLKDEGYFQGKANGEFSQDLVSALKQFQQAKGVRATGLLDLATLAWFPGAGIECELTGNAETEIEQPAGIEKFGTEVPAGLGSPEHRDHMTPTTPGRDVPKTTPHDTHPRRDLPERQEQR